MPIQSPFPSLAPYPEVPLHEVLKEAARGWPERPAITDGSRTLTFAELERESRRVERGLRRLGVGPGERVGLLAANSIAFVASLHGIVRAGAVVTPISTASKSREIAYQLEDAGACGLIYDASLGAEVLGTPAALTRWRVAIGEPAAAQGDLAFARLGRDDSAPSPARRSLPAIRPRLDLAALPYSAGTTGLPKGVMLTHFNLVANLHQSRLLCDIEIRPDDIFLNHLPFFHIYGLNVLLGMPLLCGSLQVVMRRFTPDDLLAHVARYRPTILFTVPAVLEQLCLRDDLESHDLSCLRAILTGAAPLSNSVAGEFTRRTGAAVRQGYGLTETSPVTNLCRAAGSRPGTIGPPGPDTEEKVVSLDDPGRELGPGEVGELCIRGPQVMQGYWRAPAETARALHDGWLLTGDVACIEEDGSVRIVDRKKEMIKVKGFGVAPAEVEDVLMSCPLVADCAVIGTPDPKAGELPKAFVALRESPADAKAVIEQIQAHAAARLAPYKQPREYAILPSIPRSAAGKRLRRLLKDGE